MYVSRSRDFRRSYRRQKLIFNLLLVGCALVVTGFIVTFLLFAWYAKDLPSPGKLAQINGASTVFYDRDGKVLYEMFKDKNRVPVDFNDISDNLKKATVSIEDKNFYKHGGISETGIIRSVFSIILGRGIEGGSTITQQLIKNVLLTSQRSISRKIREMILAFEVERKYSKDQILEMYLNEAPYGGNYWGVASAAHGYFNKDPKDLNLIESAILAGLPQSPSYYSPYIGQANAWKGRAKDVLRRMREDGYITSAGEKSADNQVDSYAFSPPHLPIEAPHFVFYIKDLIDQEYGPALLEQGVKVKTTLSLDVQKMAEKIVHDEIGNLKDFHVGNGAAVVLDSQTGEILAMVGSYDFNDPKFGNFNVATALRQPGSAVKPITYSVAFEKGYTPSTILMDVKTNFKPDDKSDDYIPENYDGKNRGPVQVRFALGNSINVPAVKMLAMVGIRDFLQKASDMGLDSFAPTQTNLNRFGLSITLGGGESTLLQLTSAYTVFATGGLKHDISSISEIDDFNGKTIYKSVRTNERRVLSPEISFLISHILSDNNARRDEFGPNSYLNIPGKTVAVKTGTTNDKRDNWAVGFTKSVTVGVWVGNNDNSPMNQKIASGITGASPIWYDIMNELLKKYTDGIMDKPDNVKALTVDAYLGGLPKDGYPTRSEYFISGTEPKDVSSFYKTLKISKSNGKLANDVEVKNGNYDQKDFIVITENDPVSTDGKNRWQDAINAWNQTQGDPKYHAPTDMSDSSADDCIVSIKGPGNDSTVNSNSIEVTAKVTSVSDIQKIQIFDNGNQLKEIDANNSNVDETFNLSNGIHQIKVWAQNSKGHTGDSTVTIGVNTPWDSTPTPTL